MFKGVNKDGLLGGLLLLKSLGLRGVLLASRGVWTSASVSASTI